MKKLFIICSLSILSSTAFAATCSSDDYNKLANEQQIDKSQKNCIQAWGVDEKADGQAKLPDNYYSGKIDTNEKKDNKEDKNKSLK